MPHKLSFKKSEILTIHFRLSKNYCLLAIIRYQATHASTYIAIHTYVCIYTEVHMELQVIHLYAFVLLCENRLEHLHVVFHATVRAKMTCHQHYTLRPRRSHTLPDSLWQFYHIHLIPLCHHNVGIPIHVLYGH